jgi:hypothetical protein
MNPQSVYVIPCLCGRLVESPERASRCPSCQRMLYVCTIEAAERAETRAIELLAKKAGQAC